MVQTARPVTAPTPHQPRSAGCPVCGTPIRGIAATEPGHHTFVDCGHDATDRRLVRLASE